MATSNAVWGIDIGHCALKALRCSLQDDGKTLEAEAFDYIEYPKLLTQPDADPEQLVKDALKQFLANNNLRGAKIGISVSGQSGLARFIQLPPVEAKKIPDIVKYEAKQQIPFPLDDVIWDYQRLGGGQQDDGVALGTEVGLFAMKRDQVFKAIRPFRDAGIELDLVQLTPIAIYNSVTYGVLTDELPGPHEFDPDNPPDSVVVISMGTDTTDLVITNGFKIWQRSIPIGGSHFTKQLMKDMKLTFAKAEHLKRNARDADDPKAVFQAMRPVFNDMVQELQRSIGFFRSIDREAKIGKGVILGNTVRLPGLQPYLEKNLDLPVIKVAKYEHLTGAAVVSTPKFKDNILSFAVSYGLCIQSLSKARLSTNLIPRELITARIIRQKKPWALAGVTLLMLGLMLNYVFHWNIWNETHTSRYEPLQSALQPVVSESQSAVSEDSQKLEEFKILKTKGDNVVGGADARFLVLELMTAINSVLPFDEGRDANAISELAYSDRTELHIKYIEPRYFSNLDDYLTSDVVDRYRMYKLFLREENSNKPSVETASVDTTDKVNADDEEFADDEAVSTDEEDSGESEISVDTSVTSGKSGYVIEIGGYHFFSKTDETQYIRKAILEKLDTGTVELPTGPGEPKEEFTMKEMGIHFPILANDVQMRVIQVPDPNYKPIPGADPDRNVGSNQQNIGMQPATAFEFVIQFVWIPTRASERMENKSRQSQPVDDAAESVASN